MYKLGETNSPELVEKLSARLWKAKIPHQVVSKPGEADDSEALSEVWLVRETDLPLAVEILNAPDTQKEAKGSGKSPLVASLSYAKVTWFFLIVCLIVAAITGLGKSIEFLSWLTIVPVEVRGADLYASTLDVALSSGEVWRIFTPALIHFGGLHLTFNLLWIWEFGRRIEVIDGGLRLTLVIIASAIISNLAQYFSGSILFGGMSGVIYALLGYMVVLDKLSSAPRYQLPTGIVIFMLVWLVLGYTQFTEALGMGSIANAAHTVGLFSGVGIAVLARLLFRS